ncbi:unnamed protein product [Urochloa humidicola]
MAVSKNNKACLPAGWIITPAACIPLPAIRRKQSSVTKADRPKSKEGPTKNKKPRSNPAGPEEMRGKKQSVTAVNTERGNRTALRMMVRGATHVRRTPCHVPATNRGVFSA